MEQKHGYYTGCLELNGFKTPFVVYAGSNEQAALKALDGLQEHMKGAVVYKVEGPYQSPNM